MGHLSRRNLPEEVNSAIDRIATHETFVYEWHATVKALQAPRVPTLIKYAEDCLVRDQSSTASTDWWDCRCDGREWFQKIHRWNIQFSQSLY